MTKIEALDACIVLAEGNEELVEKLEAMKASLAKKHSTDKPSKKQRENEPIKAAIADILRNAEAPMTATEIGTALGIDYRKVSALTKQIDGVVKSYSEKGKAVYSLAEAE